MKEGNTVDSVLKGYFKFRTSKRNEENVKFN